MSTIVGLVLAAGGGRRYGGPKALVRHEDGRLLVERAVATLRDGGCARIVVVLGAESARVRAEAQLGDARLVDNPTWKSGMGSSLRAGLAAMADDDVADAVAVLLVDTPGIGPDAVARLLAAAEGGPKSLVTATYQGKRGHPVILGRDHWAGVATLATADVGARAYLVAHSDLVRTVPCEDIADDTDLDVPPEQ
ncbi:NTP transferase domain-containing protein [Dactylosporangium siamense]|uniref:nucleotidyltransferase family protein n=1 Tax=Dactylosporangium siamense TaxID=685454 RepID=UPI001EF1DBFA|nr:NTP transferase domain-containing protein [Dactylosporangium siamense]